MKAVVLVEGESDRIAVEALAARRGRDLAVEDVAVVAVGGAHALERVLRSLEAERVAGLYDRGEEAAVRRVLARAGVAPDGFFACDPDLEGELVRALGAERMLQLVEERGHLSAFRTYQTQPDKRSLALEAQLHGWLNNWKVRYAAALVEALDLDRAPAPLDGVLAYAAAQGAQVIYGVTARPGFRLKSNQETVMDNAAIVKGVYEAFGNGDIPAVLGAFSPDIKWYQAESNPYMPSGQAWVGPDAVLNNLFMRLGAEWEGFAVHPRSFHGAGDSVIVEARYSGTFKATGKSMDAQVCHIWDVKGGKVTRFQQYVDTAKLKDVMGAR